MPRVISQTPVPVCSVTENCLVAAYLGQLLGADRRFRPLNWELDALLSPICRKDTVFIIDHCGLDTPLSECFRKLRSNCANAKFLVLDYKKSRAEFVR